MKEALYNANEINKAIKESYEHNSFNELYFWSNLRKIREED